MNIVVLATKSLTSNFLINSLGKGNKVHVIFENRVPKKIFWRNRVKRIGIAAALGQIMFLLLASLFQRIYRKKIQNLIGKENISVIKKPNVCFSEVTSVNSDNCIKKLIEINPDLIILNGTRIISEKVLCSVNSLFINTHCGITPKYRGVHGGYWAIYNNDLDNYGVTVHKVDAGVDTGDILYQEKVKLDSKDNYFTYPIKQYITAIPLIKELIHKISNGEELKPFKRSDLQAQSRLWYHPTLYEYLYGLLVRQVK
jgi:methionyl-tRNA formyltransferase